MLVTFEDGDPERPLVLGATWNGVDTAPTEDFWGGEYGPNDVKRIVTKSGNRIQIVDKPGKQSISLATPNNLKISLFENANETGRSIIQVSNANGDITFSAPNGRIHLHGQFISREAGASGDLSAIAAPQRAISGSPNRPGQRHSSIRLPQGEIAKSPTLTRRIRTLKRRGWTFVYGTAGGGTYADRQRKRITIDRGDANQPARLIESLSHEVGHAIRPTPTFHPIGNQTKQDFVEKNVHENLLDEADATINNIKVKQELTTNNGLQIGVAGAHGQEYEQMYNDNPSTAREAIAAMFGRGEHPSNDPSLDYHDYYARSLEQYYDAVKAASKHAP